MGIEKIAILGATCLSASLALAMKRQPEPPLIVGFDRDRRQARQARSIGAFDKITRSPGKACDEADLVIVAVPLDEVETTFAAIAPHLKEGCIVSDTAHLKTPVRHWADEHLPPGVSFIGGHIILNPATVGPEPAPHPAAADPDLLRSALYCLTPRPDTSEVVINTFSRLASMLGAIPFFMDLAEHDGIQAGISALPDLLTIALLQATVSGPAASDMRPFAGEHLAEMTAIPTEEVYDRMRAIFLNKEGVLAQLEHLIGLLRHIRHLLMGDDWDSFEALFLSALDGRARWLEERARGRWVAEHGVDLSRVPSSGKQLQSLFFTEPPAAADRAGRGH